VVGELCERNGVEQMKASISKTFTVGKGDGAVDMRFEVVANGDYSIRVVWGDVDGDGGTSSEIVSFDGEDHLDFVIEALCRLRAWQDRPKQEMAIERARIERIG
jgi:hypothetical protein